MTEDERDQKERLEHLLDIGIDSRLPPEKRLLAAVLVRATLDYFEINPADRRGVAEYFLGSSLYRRTLELFGLPPDYLPERVTVAGLIERRSQMNEPIDPETLRMKTLVTQLSGSQLKVILMMGMLSLPATAGTIATCLPVEPVGRFCGAASAGGPRLGREPGSRNAPILDPAAGGGRAAERGVPVVDGYAWASCQATVCGSGSAATRISRMAVMMTADDRHHRQVAPMTKGSRKVR